MCELGVYLLQCLEGLACMQSVYVLCVCVCVCVCVYTSARVLYLCVHVCISLSRV